MNKLCGEYGCVLIAHLSDRSFTYRELAESLAVFRMWTRYLMESRLVCGGDLAT